MGLLLSSLNRSNRSCIVMLSSRSRARISLGKWSVKNGSSSLQTLPSASSHNTFIVLQLATPSSISKRMTASSILLNELGILLGCYPFAIVVCVVVVSSFRDCAFFALSSCRPFAIVLCLRLLFARPSERLRGIYDYNVLRHYVRTWN